MILFKWQFAIFLNVASEDCAMFGERCATFEIFRHFIIYKNVAKLKLCDLLI